MFRTDIKQYSGVLFLGWGMGLVVYGSVLGLESGFGLVPAYNPLLVFGISFFSMVIGRALVGGG